MKLIFSAGHPGCCIVAPSWPQVAQQDQGEGGNLDRRGVWMAKEASMHAILVNIALVAALGLTSSSAAWAGGKSGGGTQTGGHSSGAISSSRITNIRANANTFGGSFPNNAPVNARTGAGGMQ
jgi:hypothetical protein